MADYSTPIGNSPVKEKAIAAIALCGVSVLFVFYCLLLGFRVYTVCYESTVEPMVEPTVVPQWEEVIRGEGPELLVAGGYWDGMLSKERPTASQRWSIERRGELEWRYVSWPEHYKLILSGETAAPWIKGVEPPRGAWELWQRDDGSFVFVEK